MKTDIFDTAIKCMDASYQNSPADWLDNSDIVDEVDTLIMEFRSKFEIPNETEIGNADAVEDNWDAYSKAKTELEIKIFELCWDHMKDLMLNCGIGEVAKEVFASEILNIKPSWEIKEQVKKDMEAKK